MEFNAQVETVTVTTVVISLNEAEIRLLFDDLYDIFTNLEMQDYKTANALMIRLGEVVQTL